MNTIKDLRKIEMHLNLKADDVMLEELIRLIGNKLDEYSTLIDEKDKAIKRLIEESQQ